jgi:NAD(P)-dependent dehydrogenase (short-subunit alcohol dehydrogenase family)
MQSLLHVLLLSLLLLQAFYNLTIGYDLHTMYAKEGADVAINYLPSEEQDAQEVKAVIEKAGRKAPVTSIL